MSSEIPPRRLLTLFDGLDPGSMETGKNRSLVYARGALEKAGVRQTFVPARDLHAPAPLTLWWRCLALPWSGHDALLINSLAPFVRFLPVVEALVRIARWRGLPVLMYWHESDWVLRRTKLTQRRAFRAATAISGQPWCRHLAASASTARAVRAMVGVKEEPAVVYETVLDPDPRIVPGRAAEPTVVTVATAQDRKGTDLFLTAARLVLRRMPQARFHWLGEGPDFAKYAALVRAEGLLPQVNFLGNVNRPYSFLEHAHVSFLPSRDDPFPLSVLEAMAVGLDVVAFASGGVQEALDDASAIVPDFSPELAAERLLHLLQRPAPYTANARLIARFRELYAVPRFASRFGAAIDAAINSVRG